MKVIDSDNYAASGIETFFFPGGEPHAKIPESFGDALLFLKPRTWNDMGKAMAVLGALWAQTSGGKDHGHKVWLFCPYFPGARQDRTDFRTPVMKELMANILGECVHRLYTFDLHSNTKTGIYIEKNFMPADLLHWVTSGTGVKQYVIAPDKGAHDRALSFADHIADEYGERYRGLVPVLQADKVRDFATGRITGYTLPPLPGVGCYIVVDDICDGGATFNMLAEAFERDQYGAASKLGLWVSHGIFSKGPSAIHPKYEVIITTDSWARPWTTDTPDRLDVLSLQPIIDKILEESDE